MKKYFYLFYIILYTPFISFADESGFPLKEILVQAFNFLVFATAFLFLIRNPLKIFFYKRQEDFFSFEKQAAQWEKEKQKELNTWNKKIETLKKQETGIKQKAKEEGGKFLFHKKEELKTLKSRLEKEADFLIHLEKEKSKRDLLKKWRDKTAHVAGSELKNKAPSADFQKKSLQDFLNGMSHV